VCFKSYVSVPSLYLVFFFGLKAARIYAVGAFAIKSMSKIASVFAFTPSLSAQQKLAKRWLLYFSGTPRSMEEIIGDFCT